MSLKLFIEGDLLYDAMLASIRSALESIYLETYILADDEIGHLFCQALIEGAKQGVDVRVHVDAAGSLFWGAHRIIRELKKHGVKVRWFHRWSWRRPLRYNRRNHRKLLVVDRQAAFLGGFNIHRENSRRLVGDERWRDSHVCFTGQLAAEAAEIFDDFWSHRRRWVERVQPPKAMLVPNHTRHCRRRMRCVYTEGFDGACSSVNVTTPYFVPDHRTQQALIAAAQRGVKVRLLLSRKTDVLLARWAAQAAYASLLAAGVRIFEYQPRVLHAKTAVVDGSWVTLGTANLDYRSFFVNYELNLVVREVEFCHLLEDCFEQDLLQAEEIYPVRWAQRSLFQHFLEMIGWCARRWL